MREIEHAYQVALFQWAEIFKKKIPELDMLVAIPNGGKRHLKVAQKLKAEGAKAGYPDVVLNVARGGYHNLFIEMKAEKNTPSQKQKEWHEKLRRHGSKVVVCYTAHEAEKIILDYLNEFYINEGKYE